jgi:hypothetical protein
MSDVLIKLCGMWERTRRGNTEAGHFYLAGRLGNAKILGFRNHNKQSDADPDRNFFVTEPSPPRQDRPSRDTERGQASAEAVQERADDWWEKRRAEYTKELAAKFQPDEEIPFSLPAASIWRSDVLLPRQHVRRVIGLRQHAAAPPVRVPRQQR